VLEGVLVDTDLGNVVEAVISSYERVAVVDDGQVGARPADPERSGRLSDGVELFADASADLPAGPLGQRRPRRDVRRRLRPRAP
jgi:hypothetical protein